MANEMVQKNYTTNPVGYQHGDKDSYTAMLQGELGLSPLAVGTKFETDDLLKANNVHLSAFDWVDYIKDEGGEKEEKVHFALWAVEVGTLNKKTSEIEYESGYYQGGVVLNKLAMALERNDALDDFAMFGVDVTFRREKTSSGNPIVLVDIMR